LSPLARTEHVPEPSRPATSRAAAPSKVEAIQRLTAMASSGSSAPPLPRQLSTKPKAKMDRSSASPSAPATRASLSMRNHQQSRPRRPHNLRSPPFPRWRLPPRTRRLRNVRRRTRIAAPSLACAALRTNPTSRPPPPACFAFRRTSYAPSSPTAPRPWSPSWRPP
jgi:hypothetical protein